MMPDKYLTDDVLNEIIAGAKTSMEQYLALSLRAERAAVQSCGNQEQLELVSQPYKLPPNSFTDAELEMMSHGDNPQANAYRELLTFRRNNPVIPDGWVMVPIDPSEKMLIAGLEKANPLGGLIDWDASRDDCNTREQVRDIFKAMLAAAPQQG